MYVIVDGHKVKRLRRGRWFDRQEFARMAGVSDTTCRELEMAGEKVCRLRTARLIAGASGVHPRQISRPAPDALAAPASEALTGGDLTAIVEDHKQVARSRGWMVGDINQTDRWFKD